MKDVEQLASIAKDEPQNAYTAFTKAICMRWSFLQRTIPNTKDYFVPLEETIRERLIPAIIGRRITDVERKLVSLPVRMGGLGIQDPTITADIEFRNSSFVTRNLTDLIQNQETNLDNYDNAQVKTDILKMKAEKEQSLTERLEEVKNSVDEKLKRSIELACEKGASAWLSAVPLQTMGFVLNRQEFRDAICLRYGWKIPHTPSFCVCGKSNSVEHTLNCKWGGYVYMRHNNVRDLEALMLKEVCKDVRTEPELIPIGDTEVQSSIKGDKARADVSAVGFWSPMERTFLDVQIIHPNSSSYLATTQHQLYIQKENEKKACYNDRILQVEKGSFTPLIFTTTGGMGPESTRYHKKLAKLISAKRGEEYSHVVSHIRTRLRFAILRSTLFAIRGDRGRNIRKLQSVPLSEVSYNLVPEQEAYET